MGGIGYSIYVFWLCGVVPEDLREGLHDLWVEVRAAALLHEVQGVAGRPGVLVRAGAGQGVEHVARGEDPGGQGMAVPLRPRG